MAFSSSTCETPSQRHVPGRVRPMGRAMTTGQLEFLVVRDLQEMSRPFLTLPLELPTTLSPTPLISPSSARPTKPPPNTNISLLLLCTHLQEAKQVHALMIKSCQFSDTYSASRLAEFYSISDHGCLSYAEKILNSIHEPCPFLWNILIRGNINKGNFFNAIILFRRMLRTAFVQPDHFTFTSVLKACTQLPDLDMARQVHCQVVKYELDSEAYVRNKFIHLYSIFGLVDDARRLFDSSRELDVVAWNSMLECYAGNRDEEALNKLFDELPVRDVVSWNTMIAFYVQVGEFTKAVEMFQQMCASGECPDRVTFVSVLSAIAHLGALAQGMWIHAYIYKNGIEVDENLGSALISMYAKCGCLKGAVQTFKKVGKKSVDIWNGIISGLASNGQSLKAIQLFSTMESAGIRPDAITFACVLNACSHGGLVKEGLGCFEKMTEVYGIEPYVAHYGCMIDLFGRAGLFDKADEMIRTMPMVPDVVMWKALSASCRIHKNLKMGEQAGIQLVELAPDDHASYVLLSNIYAMVNNWEGVNNVRRMMRERGIKKPPGCSSIELEGVVHEFVVGDTSNSRKKEIYNMLKEMEDRLKLSGYEPDTDQVLLGIDEDEVKQSSLNYHSEKLAVAFGFISTIPGTTIRVVKNLRVCSDCHSVMKLLSKIYSRVLIIRDSNRFHYFRDGSCSCMDYW